MNLNWSNRVIKYVLFVFNLLFVISGIIMIAVGVSVKSYYTDYDIFLNDSYFSLPNLLIATGSLIFFISFFGCCGAVRESWFMIFIFSILLSLIFILEFSAGIAGYVLRDKTTSFLEEKLLASMKNYQFYDKDPNGVTKMWDTIQFEFQCCGADGPEDWQKVPHGTTAGATTTQSIKPSVTPSDTTTASGPTAPNTVTTSGPTTPKKDTTVTEASPTTVTVSTMSTIPDTEDGKNNLDNPSALQQLPETGKQAAAEGVGDPDDLPASCCKSRPGAAGAINCNLKDNTTATINAEGCVSAFGSYLKDHAVTLGGVGIAIALIQLFGVIFACHLTKQLKHGFYST